MSYRYSSRGSAATAQRRQRSSRSKPTTKRGRGVYINPSLFVQAANPSRQESYTALHTFNDFNIDKVLKNNLEQRGYTVPSPIQDQTIPAGLAKQDIIGVASTGTGKTAAFILPILNRLMTETDSYALVVAPTRELAQQIEQEAKNIGKNSGLHGAILIGGTGMNTQLRDLRFKPRIVIGTPGRIKDHLGRGTLKLDNFNMVVLDEVDRMLDMGFVNDVTEILSLTNKNRQSYFFSATIDPKVRTLIDRFTNNPHVVSIKASSASENVHQDIVKYGGNEDKIDKLHSLLIEANVSKAIVFDETKYGVERLSKALIARGFNAESIHGGKTQGQRQRALSKFKQNQVNILVATDVAARGIDVADISHVVNYSIPKAYDDYIHRIGRAGRAGKIGYALTFVESRS